MHGQGGAAAAGGLYRAHEIRDHLDGPVDGRLQGGLILGCLRGDIDIAQVTQGEHRRPGREFSPAHGVARDGRRRGLRCQVRSLVDERGVVLGKDVGGLIGRVRLAVSLTCVRATGHRERGEQHGHDAHGHRRA